MARILEETECENFHEDLDSEHVIIILPESALVTDPIQSSFRYIEDPRGASSPGKYYLRCANEFERGLHLGRLLELIPSVSIYSRRPEVIKKYLPEAIVVPMSRDVMSPPSPALKLSSPEKPVQVEPSGNLLDKPKKNEPLQAVYWDALNKYVDTYLLIDNLCSIKRQSVTNQLKNLCNGSLNSKKMPMGDLPGPDEVAELIYQDLKKNLVIEEYGNRISFNEELISEIFQAKRKKMKTCFDPKIEEKDYQEVCGKIKEFIGQQQSVKLMTLYNFMVDCIISVIGSDQTEHFKEISKTILNEFLTKKILLYEGDAQVKDIAETPIQFSNLELRNNL